MYTHIYLSPHLDDGVLSCGGRIWQQAHAGERIQVVTIFAGTPEADALLSPFAQELHARWGHEVEAAAKRQEEDLEALDILAADVLHWPYTDCVYRQTADGHFPYASEESLWGEIHSGELELIAELTARIAALGLSLEGLLYAPLGIGHHVDHQIVRRAAEGTGRGLIYYADYPYAQEPGAIQAALGPRDKEWRAEFVPLSEEALEAKTAAIAQYRSQISTFWPSLTAMAATIRAFAEQTGGGRPAEQYWTLDP